MAIENVKISNPYSDLAESDKPFKAIVTLDPTLTSDSWSRLSRSVWASEVGLWPILLHGALVRGIKSSKVIARR